jgi:hypothetical protein
MKNKDEKFIFFNELAMVAAAKQPTPIFFNFDLNS